MRSSARIPEFSARATEVSFTSSIMPPAITDLAQYGYPELVPTAVASHRHHIRLWRNLPNVTDEFGQKKISQHSPHNSAYWTSGRVPYDRALLSPTG